MMSDERESSLRDDSSLQRQGFMSQLIEAISLRAFFLVVGVLLIQLGFILSYVGAFHYPTPYRIPIVVVAPTQVSGSVVSQLNALRGQPLNVSAVASQAAGLRLLHNDSTSGVLVVGSRSPSDTLYVATGGGAAVAQVVDEIITQVAAVSHQPVTAIDAVPAQPGDSRGLTGFYLVVGWLVGGYLMAAVLGMTRGSRPATTRRAIIRLIVLAPYAIVSGLGGAIIVGPVLGALDGHFVALWWLGALLVYCAAAVTM